MFVDVTTKTPAPAKGQNVVFHGNLSVDATPNKFTFDTV